MFFDYLARSFFEEQRYQPACDFVKGIRKTPKTYLNFKNLVKKCKNLTHLLSNAAKYVMNILPYGIRQANNFLLVLTTTL